MIWILLIYLFYCALFNFFLKYLNINIFMYLMDHVAELRFVNRLIYAIKRIYTHTQVFVRFFQLNSSRLEVFEPNQLLLQF